MNTKHQHSDESAVPANSGIDIPEKAGLPDDDRTYPGTLPSTDDEAREAIGEDNLVQEHHTGRDHAEPTDVTSATNDNALDSEYIDIGGGD